MARGKGGYSEPVIPSRRNPVRIEDVDHIYTGSRKAARISDFANEDSEDISRRSHQKDRKLLDDITTKLVNSAYTPPPPPRVRGGGARVHRPPVAPMGRRPAAATAGVPRRVGIRPVPSLSTSAYRASSVPPRYVEAEVVTPYNFYEVATTPSVYYRSTPPSVSTQPRSFGASRAHSEPPLQRSSTLAVKNARRCLDRIERELGVDDGDLYGTAPVTVVREPVVRARTAARSSAGRPVVRRRPGSNPPPASRSRGVSNAEIEREVEEYLERPVVRTSLRSRASSLDRALASPQLSRLPPPLVSPSLVRRGRSGSLAGALERMPALDPYRPQQGTTNNHLRPSGGGYSTAVAPYTPARISRPGGQGLPPKAPVTSYTKPEMSDTRKRIRDVICMTRRDPHYYS